MSTEELNPTEMSRAPIGSVKVLVSYGCVAKRRHELHLFWSPAETVLRKDGHEKRLNPTERVALLQRLCAAAMLPRFSGSVLSTMMYDGEFEWSCTTGTTSHAGRHKWTSVHVPNAPPEPVKELLAIIEEP